jgi:hypothetical protein
MTVRYSLQAMKRAGVVGGGRAVQFVTKAEPGAALEALVSAATVAEEPHLEAGLNGEDTISTSSYTQLPDGPMAFMHLCDNADLLAHWMRVVADQLEQAGLSGRLQVAKSVEPLFLNVPALTAVIALQIEQDTRLAAPHLYGTPPIGWWVSQDRTDRVIPALVDWVLEAPGEVYLFAGIGMHLTPEAAKSILLSMILSSNWKELKRVTEDRRQQRRLVVHEEGGVIVSSYDADSTWLEQFEALQAPLRQAAPAAVHALVRPLPPVDKQTDAWERPPATPYAATVGVASTLGAVAHLLGEYVPDAYAQQVLTTAQLDRIGELPAERWEVEDLAAGRHLVTARDLAPWLDVNLSPYSPEDTYMTRAAIPEAAILAQARADFGPAILTPEVLRANPTPSPTGPRLHP